MSITTTDAALLRLLAWLSPAFPYRRLRLFARHRMGGGSRRHPDETTLRDWLADVLAHGAGRSDAILLHHAHRAAFDADALADIAELAEAAAPCRERRKETLDQGTAFLLAVAAWAPPRPSPKGRETHSPPWAGVIGPTRSPSAPSPASTASTRTPPPAATCKPSPPT